MTDAPEISGRVNLQEYEVEEYVAGLEPVAARLQAECPDGKFDAKSLAMFIAQLRQFMEDALGLKALPPRPCPKVPAKLLQDVSPSGAVYTIAKRCEEIRRGKSLKRVDFANPARRKENLDILLQVRADLKRLGLLANPRIHLHGSLQEKAPELQRFATQLGAEIMPSPDAPGVTHIVYPFGPSGDPDDGVQYMRKLTTRGSKALVHWWYAPDSYDGLISADTAPEEAEPDRRVRGPWKVYLRWLSDSARFNEWMNPIDYETEEFQQEQEAIAQQSPKGTHLKETRSFDKRKRADGHVGPLAKRISGEAGRPGLTRAKGPHKPLAPERVEDISQGQRDEIDAFRPSHGIPRVPPPADAHTTSAIPRQDEGPTKELYRVPAHAAWFSYGSVHANERSQLPEFFANQKSAKMYMDFRNAMINKYREDKSRKLSYTDARRMIIGDATAILRIYTFLDGWGLINFEAKDEQVEPQEPNLGIFASEGAPTGYRMLYTPPPANLDSLFRFSAPSTANAVSAATNTAGGGVLMDLLTRRDEHGASALTSTDPLARYFCNAMPWVDCTACRYHCTKIPDIDLCPEAYAEGRFPPGCSGKDFVKIDQQELQAEGPWRDLETLLLLEGIQKFGDNWGEVAAHVGTKSQVQCIMHFLQLPIEDEFMAELAQPVAPKGHPLPPAALTPPPPRPADSTARADGSAQPGADSAQEAAVPLEQGIHHQAVIPDGQPIPFADTGNPIMAQLAFLAAMVGPKVAAAAAQAALESLTAEDPAVAHEAANGMSNGGDGEKLDDGPAPSAARVRIAAATALGAAAVKARVMADEEEREVRRCVLAAAEAQVERIGLKLKHFDALEAALHREREALALARDKLFADRIQLQKEKLAAAASLAQAEPAGPAGVTAAPVGAQLPQERAQGGAPSQPPAPAQPAQPALGSAGLAASRMPAQSMQLETGPGSHIHVSQGLM